MICHGPPPQLIDDDHLLEDFLCQSIEGHMLACLLAGWLVLTLLTQIEWQVQCLLHLPCQIPQWRRNS